MNEKRTPLLSICIATRNRAKFLGMTLDTLLPQCSEEVEVVVVDGASTDDTRQVVEIRSSDCSLVRYFPQRTNSGVDRDFDKAVESARGMYCWLLPDDDLPTDMAVRRIVDTCHKWPAAVIIDAEVRSADLEAMISSRRLPFTGERRYQGYELERLLADCGECLTFIGALIIRRDIWLARDRASYIGSEFIHVGVFFQAPLRGEVVVLGESLLRIRYGVGNWMTRASEVWLFKWPGVVWSFSHISREARSAITARYPWRRFAKLLLYRAKGWYHWATFRSLIAPLDRPWPEKIPGFVAAIFPGRWAHRLVKFYLQFCPGRYSGIRWDLRLSPYADADEAWRE